MYLDSLKVIVAEAPWSLFHIQKNPHPDIQNHYISSSPWLMHRRSDFLHISLEPLQKNYDAQYEQHANSPDQLFSMLNHQY